MTIGKVVAIYIGPSKGDPMRPVSAADAVSGRGLEGDRYWQGETATAKTPGPDREVTLIEAEAIEALHRDHGVEFDAGESRRNIVTRGVPLNHMVEREFRVGGVTLRGIRLCEPCARLEKLTRPGVKDGLIHRGGLRAQILSDGAIHVGDPVEF